MSDSIVIIEEEDIKENRKENKENVSHRPLNGIEILKIAVSPKGDYAVTYNNDNYIVGWNITEKKNSSVKIDPVEEERDIEMEVDIEIKVEDDEIETGDDEMEVEDGEIETGDNEKKVEDDEKKVKNVKMKENVEIKVSNRDSKMVVVIYKVWKRWIHKIYKLGNKQPIKEYKNYERNEISFTLDGKIVQCQYKLIKVYSLSNTNNKLKLESVYKISIDTLREYGITENKI